MIIIEFRCILTLLIFESRCTWKLLIFQRSVWRDKQNTPKTQTHTTRRTHTPIHNTQTHTQHTNFHIHNKHTHTHTQQKTKNKYNFYYNYMFRPGLKFLRVLIECRHKVTGREGREGEEGRGGKESVCVCPGEGRWLGRSALSRRFLTSK